MSFLKRNALMNFSLRLRSPFSFVSNGVRLNRLQYHTLINTRNVRPEVFKSEIVERHLFGGRVRYFPILGSVKFKLAGYLWYNTLDDIDIKEFFTLFDLPDTFYSRYKVIELHVWMLLFCLPQKSRVNSLVRYGLIQAMWEDAEKRAKLVNKNNKNYKKDIRHLYEDFKISLLLYDVGYSKDDTSLSSALWYCFFKKSDVDPRLLEALVYFVRYQMQFLQKLDMNKLTELGQDQKKGQIWISPKPFVESILEYRTSKGFVALNN